MNHLQNLRIRSLPLLIICGLGMAACSKKDEPAPAAKVGDGQIEIKAAPPMPEARNPNRELTVTQGKLEPAPGAAKLNPAETTTLRKEDRPKELSVVPADTTALKMQNASQPQTPALRMDARNQAMMEMLRVKKAPEKP